jgi:hypothetical protein
MTAFTEEPTERCLLVACESPNRMVGSDNWVSQHWKSNCPKSSDVGSAKQLRARVIIHFAPSSSEAKEANTLSRLIPNISPLPMWPMAYSRSVVSLRATNQAHAARPSTFRRLSRQLELSPMPTGMQQQIKTAG